MKEIINFIRTIKEIKSKLNQLSPKTKEKYKIKFVLGNNPCDIDSFISSVLLAFIRNIQSKFIHVSKNDELTYCYDTTKDYVNTLYIPILNCRKEELFWQLDVKELLDRYEIFDDDLFFYDEEVEIVTSNNRINWKNLSLLEKGTLTYEIILVNHHQLLERHVLLSNYVTEIIDSHDDNDFNYKEKYPFLQSKKCEFPLASTTSLILEEFFNNKDVIENHETFFRDNYFDFLIAPVLINSFNFSSDLFDRVWTRKDKEYAVRSVNSLRRSIFSNVIEEIQFLNDFDYEHMDRLYEILYKSKTSNENNLSIGLKGLLNKNRVNKSISIRSNLVKLSYIQYPIDLSIVIQKYGIKEFCNVIDNESIQSEVDIFLIYYNIEEVKNQSKSNKTLVLHYITKRGFIDNSVIFNHSQFDNYHQFLNEKMKSTDGMRKNIEIIYNYEEKDNMFLLNLNECLDFNCFFSLAIQFFENCIK